MIASAIYFWRGAKTFSLLLSFLPSASRYRNFFSVPFPSFFIVGDGSSWESADEKSFLSFLLFAPLITESFLWKINFFFLVQFSQEANFRLASIGDVNFVKGDWDFVLGFIREQQDEKGRSKSIEERVAWKKGTFFPSFILFFVAVWIRPLPAARLRRSFRTNYSRRGLLSSPVVTIMSPLRLLLSIIPLPAHPGRYDLPWRMHQYAARQIHYHAACQELPTCAWKERKSQYALNMGEKISARLPGNARGGSSSSSPFGLLTIFQQASSI